MMRFGVFWGFVGLSASICFSSGSLFAAENPAIDLLQQARQRADQGEDLQATPYYRQVLGLAEQELGELSPALSRLRLEVGALHFRQGRLDEAKALFASAASTLEPVLGDRHPQLALALAGLAAVHLKMGQDDLAKGYWEQAREILNAPDLAPVASPKVFSQLPIWSPGRRATETAEDYRKALKSAEASGDRLAQIAALHRLGSMQSKQGKEGRAADFYEQALRLQRAMVGDENSSLIPHLDSLAEVYRRQGRQEAALVLQEQSLRLAEGLLGPEDLSVARRLADLGVLCQELGRHEKAASYLVRAVASTDHWLQPAATGQEMVGQDRTDQDKTGQDMLVASPERGAKKDPYLVVADPRGDAETKRLASGEPTAPGAVAAKPGWQESDSKEIRYWAQLASRRDQEMARGELFTLQNRFAAVLGDLPARVEEVALEGSGIWYRLQFGAFESKREGKDLCAALARSGFLDCWVVSRP